MAPSEDESSEAADKKCKYCRSGVDKAGVKCCTCKVVYHQSCSLRLSGMLVISGSKALIQCPTCAKNGRDEDINKAVKEAIIPKDLEIKALKSKLEEIEQAKALEKQTTAHKPTNESSSPCRQNGESEEFKHLKKDFESLNRECTLLKCRITDLEYICSLQKVVISSYEEKVGKIQQNAVVNKPTSVPSNSQSQVPAINPPSGTVPARKPPVSNESGTQATSNQTENKNGNSVGSSFATTVSRQRQTSAASTSTSMGKQNINKQISNQEVGAAILEVQSRNLLNNLINIQQPIEENPPSQDRDGWEYPKSRKRRRFVVGKNENITEVRGVPRHVSLHVTRLSPSTKPEDLKNMLLDHFPEVICESHISKQPTLYASMKVTIKQEHFREAWRKEVWPNGALVSRFLVKRRNLSQETVP